MKLFDWFAPLDSAIAVVDKAVVDQDLKLQLRAELQRAEQQLRAMAMESYAKELAVPTVPWVDALHKMGRQIISVLNILVGAALLSAMIFTGHEVDLEVMLALVGLSGPGAIYNVMKGKGR